jgi:hypothetical protein
MAPGPRAKNDAKPVITRPTRFDLAWGAVLLACAVALCFLPLFDLLAFEFAFVMGLPVTIAAGSVGLRYARRLGPGQALLAARRAVTHALALAAVPLVPITLNMLRVRNCNYTEGLAVYALLPGLSAVVGALWGTACGLLTPRRGGWLYAAIVVGSVAMAIYAFWVQPPIDAFNAFLGYYPGSLYDEVIPLDDRLLWSRTEDLAWAFAAMATVMAVRKPEGAHVRRRYAWGFLTLLAVLAVRLTATVHDVHRNAGHIQIALGGRHEAPGLVVYHPKAWPAEAVTDLALELRFALGELEAFFGVEPSGPVEVYLYQDERSKKRLMGAGGTRIAKPWQRAIHVHAPAVGQEVLRHELAHVVAAEIAEAPLHVSLYKGFIPHPGLIEGAAVAATWDGGRLDPHQWTAAMRRIGVAPAIESVMQPDGFLTSNSRAAYTMCGSFVRYLREKAGSEVLARVYRTGTFDPDGDASFEALAKGWLAHVDAQPLSEGALAMAQVRFDRPAIFGKVCAHEVAALWDVAEGNELRGDFVSALAKVDEILGHVPRDADAALHRAELQYRVGDVEGARATASVVAERQDVGIARRARAREWLADLEGLAGRPEAAREAYEASLKTAFDRAQERRLAVKLAALDAGEAGLEVLKFLAAPPSGNAAEAVFARLGEVRPDWSVGRYLLGRRQIQKRAWAQGEETLRAALAAGLPHPSLQLEAERLLAESLFSRRRYAEAAAAYAALAERVDLGLDRGEAEALRTWSRRARFFEAHRDTPAPTATVSAGR